MKFPVEAETTLKDAMRSNPRGSRKEHLEAVWGGLSKKAIREIFEYWFGNVYRTYFAEIEKGSVAILKIQRESREQAKSPDHKERRKALKIKIAISLLDFQLSNGKLLRNCTGQELMDEGGWLYDAGKKIGPKNIAGNVLTENDLKNLKMRNSSQSKRLVA